MTHSSRVATLSELLSDSLGGLICEVPCMTNCLQLVLEDQVVLTKLPLWLSNWVLIKLDVVDRDLLLSLHLLVHEEFLLGHFIDVSAWGHNCELVVLKLLLIILGVLSRLDFALWLLNRSAIWWSRAMRFLTISREILVSSIAFLFELEQGMWLLEADDRHLSSPVLRELSVPHVFGVLVGDHSSITGILGVPLRVILLTRLTLLLVATVLAIAVGLGLQLLLLTALEAMLGLLTLALTLDLVDILVDLADILMLRRPILTSLLTLLLLLLHVT